jgi:hypothetical protein
MQVWKKSFIVVAGLLAVFLFISVILWYQLGDAKTQQNVTEAQLQNTRSELDVSKIELTNTKTELDASISELASTKAELNIRDSELANTRGQLEAVKVEQKAMLDGYATLREQVNMRFGLEQDCQSFITPDSPAVSDKVKEITGSYSEDTNELWRDSERLYRWVTENIEYSYDSYTPKLPEDISQTLTWTQEFWRTPEETLDDKTGDCEDMATLLASMLLNYNEGKFTIWCVLIQNERVAHAAVAFPVQGDKLTILDPAGKYLTGLYGSIGSKDIDVAISEWLSYWQRNDMPGAQVCGVFSNTFYREFSGTEEFINWAREY